MSVMLTYRAFDTLRRLLAQSPFEVL
jgi:hypothetical protein